MKKLLIVLVVAYAAIAALGAARPKQPAPSEIKVKVQCVNGVPTVIEVITTGAGFWKGVMSCPAPAEAGTA